VAPWMKAKWNATAKVGAALVATLVLFSIVVPFVSHHDPFFSDFDHGTLNGLPKGPSAEFWLGTDRIFRDQLVRLAYGGRISIVIGIFSTAIAIAIGAVVGVVSGYFEGSRGVRVPLLFIASVVTLFLWVVLGKEENVARAFSGPNLGVVFLVLAGIYFVTARAKGLSQGPTLNADVALMRFVDVGLAFPFLLLVMAVGVAFDRTTPFTILATLGLSGWLGTARLVRAKTLQIRNQEFVLAARALGESNLTIIRKHIVPNIFGLLVVIATLSVAQMIVAESVLSYLGAGIAPPDPTWGHMLFEGQESYTIAPWLLVAPATILLLTVLGFNLLGEGLRDALDPKTD